MEAGDRRKLSGNGSCSAGTKKRTGGVRTLGAIQGANITAEAAHGRNPGPKHHLGGEETSFAISSVLGVAPDLCQLCGRRPDLVWEKWAYSKQLGKSREERS